MPLGVVRSSRGLTGLRILGRAACPVGIPIVALVVRVAGDGEPPGLLRCLAEITVIAVIGAMRRGSVGIDGDDRADGKDAVGDVWA